MDRLDYANEMRWEWAPFPPSYMEEATIPEMLAARREVGEGPMEWYERPIHDSWVDAWEEEMAWRFAPTAIG